ncbi:hypothetical protein WMF38_57730 [Sorangium sp. So ce118]
MKAIVVKWADDGNYLTGVNPGKTGDPTTVAWSPRQRAAWRFANRRAFKEYSVSRGVGTTWLEEGWWRMLQYRRLVPRKPHASPQP